MLGLCARRNFHRTDEIFARLRDALATRLEPLPLKVNWQTHAKKYPEHTSTGTVRAFPLHSVPRRKETRWGNARSLVYGQSHSRVLAHIQYCQADSVFAQSGWKTLTWDTQNTKNPRPATTTKLDYGVRDRLSYVRTVRYSKDFASRSSLHRILPISWISTRSD